VTEIPAAVLKDRAFGAYERSLAFRYLRAKREHGGVTIVSILSLVGIALAVAALIIIMSIMNGFRTELITRVLGNAGHVEVVTGQYSSSEVDQLIYRLETRSDVVSAMPIVQNAALGVSDVTSSGVFVRGMSVDDALSLPFLQEPIYSGTTEAFGEGRLGGNGIFVSERLARELYIRAGDELTLIAPQTTSTVGGMIPRRKVYHVQGLFQVFAGNANPLDEVLVIMPLEQAQVFFNSKGKYPLVELKLDNPQNVEAVMERLKASDIPQGLLMRTWKERYSGLVGALEVEKSMMRMIFAILITITALNIITGIVMLVKNKSRDIAILRTMGASRSTVLRVFLMIGALLGISGLAIGMVLGIAFCVYIRPIQDFLNAISGGSVFNPEVYGLPYLPALIDWSEVAFAGAYAFVISVIVALLPAWNATRLDPVEALRSE
tara:strand:- start:63661 stop:64965 length:1305 start_codon:yes stop_codon:yes gene_type:complete